MTIDAFMATMAAPASRVADEHAVAWARERYGLAVHAARLSGERDENFRLTANARPAGGLPGG